MTGMVAGLACVTPASGWVPTWAGFVIGILASCVCYGAIWIKNKLNLDDALDVWGVHGVGGFFGVIFTGLFASTKANPHGADGLVFGGGAFFGKQVAAALLCAAWAFCFSYGMLYLINFVTPVIVEPKKQEDIDLVELGETAYLEGDGGETSSQASMDVEMGESKKKKKHVQKKQKQSDDEKPAATSPVEEKKKTEEKQPVKKSSSQEKSEAPKKQEDAPLAKAAVKEASESESESASESGSDEK